MSHRLKIGTLSVLLALVVLAAYGVGRWQGYEFAMGYLKMEVQGNLSRNVEALSRLRTGNEQGAIELFETAIDAAAATLPMDGPFNNLPEQTRLVLSAARVYRDAFPSKLSPIVFQDVPRLPPHHSYCSDALRQVNALSKAGDGS